MAAQVFTGRYQIVRHLARGGMAEVYLARDLLLDRPVALKVLFPEFATDRSFVERFRREARSAANLNHISGTDLGSGTTAVPYAIGNHPLRPSATATLTFGAIAAQTCTPQTITVPGAKVGDVVELGYHVRSAFYTLQASEQAYRVAKQGLDALAAGSEAARALLAAGNIAQLDASSQIAAFERARIVVAKLELTIAE